MQTGNGLPSKDITSRSDSVFATKYVFCRFHRFISLAACREKQGSASSLSHPRSPSCTPQSFVNCYQRECTSQGHRQDFSPCQLITGLKPSNLGHGNSLRLGRNTKLPLEGLSLCRLSFCS